MYYEIFLLNFLGESPSYGYVLKKKLAEKASGNILMNNNTIYPILKRYELQGIATKKSEVVEGRPSRYIYSITEYGRKYFVDLIRNFPDSLMESRDEFFARLTVFAFLDKPTRIRLLDVREKCLIATKEMLDKANLPPTIANPFPEIAMDFYYKLIESEQEVILHYRKHIEIPCTMDENGHITS